MSARWAPATAPLAEFAPLFTLYLTANRDADAAALLARRLAAVDPKRGDAERTAVIDSVVRISLDAQPVRLAVAESLLTEVGIAHLADRTFGTLSEGERKRVQIARALMVDPELLLLDEPAAGLDLGGREDLVSTLSTLAFDPDSPATILVSHHVEEIPPGFTHVLMLRRGAVVAAGLLERELTEANRSRTFGMPLVLEGTAGRYTARRRTRRAE